MEFNRMDICEAYYLFAVLWHGGQWSKEYRIFGRLNRIGFRPSSGLSIHTLTENGRAIYDGLVERLEQAA